MKKHLSVILYAGLLTWLASCGGPSTTNQPPPEPKADAVTILIPEFNSDSAYTFVEKQVAFGPRVCNTPAHEKCADYLESRFRMSGAEVTVQKGTVRAYDGTALKMKNIIASFLPEAKTRILLCAHWDSRPFADHDPDPARRNQPIDGANDGASGVGVLLEVARQLQMNPPAMGVDLILFDAEDYGPPDHLHHDETGEWWGLGSQYWAKQPHKSGYSAKYGILLDMVGAPNATFLQEAFSLHYASDIVSKVWSKAAQAGYSSYFINEQGPPINDDHLYINKIMNLPTIDIIHLDKSSPTGFFPYWHTAKDNMSTIDRNTLKAVGQTVLKVIYEER